MKLDQPSNFDITQHHQNPPPPAEEPVSPQKLNNRQIEKAGEILDKTSPGGKAVQILQKYWQVGGATQQINDGAESIFSAEIAP